MKHEQLTAEDCKGMKLPLSEKDFRTLESLPAVEYNKLPEELQTAFQEYSYKEWRAMGMNDWD